MTNSIQDNNEVNLAAVEIIDDNQLKSFTKCYIAKD